MRLNELTIKSNIKDYFAYFENDDQFLKDLALLNNAVYIIDENVWNLHKNGCLRFFQPDRVIVQPVREEIKTIDTVCELYEKIMQYTPKKNMNLVSIGGGIVQDLTGFVASSLYRGLHWIFVPTTLLAQVDSCIGAKTSLNFKHFKNLVGTFYPPAEIHVYTEFLKTLIKADYYSGVGEMAKLHLMNGKEDTLQLVNLWEKIDRIDDTTILERIQACLKIKKSYIEDDEFDTGKRNMLNYGHCFGHAIESATDFAISHGQAVVVGMIIANEEAEKRGFLNSETNKFFKEKVLLPSLITDMSGINIDIDRTIQAMGQDKKNTGQGLALVMIKDGYEMVKINDLTHDEAKTLLENFIKSVRV
ncbi:MAG: 3-dehydroquinate synthase [Spirochaetae bacterium HGW-Spirochaetae-5]|jgi:3-dehydroquinate synthase|nr:MAG: 3-dehydroquinate synthase [Spirochaetae bacterium HGW-Spirochaetae-5]